MIAIFKQSRQTTNAQHDERFLEMIPAIEHYARRAFRKLQPQLREEAIGTVVANAFCAFRRLVELGKQEVACAISLASYAVSRFRAGRCISDRRNSRDVSAAVAQHRRGFCLYSLDTSDSSNIWYEVLADDTLTPIPDQVAFRLDFPVWFYSLNQRDRKLAKFLALGNTTSEAAQQFGVTRGRISQLRKELQASWQEFQQDELREV